jgi:hypothetical protein
MSNQQFYVALAVPSFLILVGWMINFQGYNQGYKMMANRLDDLRREFGEFRSDVKGEINALRSDVKAETATLRTIA